MKTKRHTFFTIVWALGLLIAAPSNASSTHLENNKYKQEYFDRLQLNSIASGEFRSTKRTPLEPRILNLSKASVSENDKEQVCKVDQLHLHSSQSLIEEIVKCAHSDFGEAIFIENDSTRALFSERNMLTFAHEIKRRSALYSDTDRQSLAQLMLVARAGFYIEFYSSLLNYSESVNDSFRTAAEVFALNQHFLDTDDDHGKVLSEWIDLVDGSENWTHFYNDFFSIYRRYPTQGVEQTTYYGIKPLYNVQYAIWRGQHNSQVFSEMINNDRHLIELLNQFISRMEGYEKSYDEGALTNAIATMARLLSYPKQKLRASNSIEHLLTRFSRLSATWLYLAKGISDYGNCSEFLNVCLEDIKPELMTKAFPNTYVFDDGALTIRTAVGEKTAQTLYHAQKQVEAQYKKKNSELEPLSSDVNHQLTMFVYGSRYDYELMQTLLFGLDTGNGGIYIEAWGQFFTYERTSDESIYTLEELFRHEYVHYLQGRYTVEGLWGEADFYRDNRLTWYEEGGAEFFAGATQANGVALRKVMLEQIAADRGEHMTIKEITEASYSSGFKFYRYSALLFNFLNDTQPQTITQLHKVIRAGDIVTFNNMVSSLSNDEEIEASFAQYIVDQVSNIDDVKDFTPTDFPLPSYLDTDLLEDVQKSIRSETVFSTAVCINSALSMNARFTCTGYLSGKNYQSLSEKVDLALQALNNKLNNFTTLNCAIGDTVESNKEVSASYSCEGGLRRLGTERNTNQPPVADAGANTSAYLRELVEINGSASSDPEGDSLTYSWNQIGGEAIENVDPVGGFDKVSLSFYLYEEHLDEDVKMELSVFDGEHVSTDIIVITAKQDSSNEAPVADAGEDVTVSLRQLVILSAHGSYDPDGDELSYTWMQKSGLPVDNVSSEGGFDKISFAFYAYEEHFGSDLRFELNVSDGKSTSTDLVTVRVGNVINHFPPEANAGENRTARVGDSVQISGIDSTDADGNILTYRWKQISGEPVENVEGEEGIDKSSFSFHVYDKHQDSDLIFELTVSDGVYTSTDTVTVSVASKVNTAPIASAGEDQTVGLRELVILSGERSFDYEGDNLQYKWRQLQGATVENVDPVGGFDTVSFAFYGYEPHENTELLFELTVSDGKLTSTDVVTVKIRAN